MESSNIGKFIREFRVENDLTLRDLAQKSGISFSHLSKIERGEHVPSKKTLDIISESTNLDKDKLYVLSGYAPSSNLGVGLDHLLGGVKQKDLEKITIIKNISNEFPDIDLMFKDMEDMTAEQLQDVYEFIKFKKEQNK